MAYADDLATIRENLVARIASVTASNQPTYTDGSRTVDKAGYLRELFAQLENINRLMGESAPVEIVTRMGSVW